MNCSKKLAILVSSCDKYNDLWVPFFYFLRKYWSDCPYQIYLATNTLNIAIEGVTILHSNKFTNWSDETSSIIKLIPNEYILYLQDDYFLTQKVENKTIHFLFDKLISLDADYLRLFPSPGPDEKFKNDQDIGLISIDAPFRTSLQCAIWKKDTFLKILIDNEDPWQFEKKSPTRSKEYLFLSVKRKEGKIQSHIYPVTYYYRTAVLKGKWLKEVIKICEDNGLIIDKKHRKIESFGEVAYRKLYSISPKFLRRIFNLLENYLF